MSSSLLQLNTIFISILIEALPFVLLGVFISGIIQVFITEEMMAKGVPLYAAIPFMFTGPIINPVVLFSTYVAFGNNWAVVWERSSVALVVAIVVGMLLTFQFKTDQTKHSVCVDVQKKTFGQKLVGTIQHSIDEFFSVGKYLIIGALIAASMQTFMKTSILLDLGQQDWSAHFVMMGLAYLLSPLYFYQFPS
ncbi:hypothetical protein SAMN05880580_11122 [Priestia flexa]|nr:hypothetical protein SAMN05880580_11122 [Priestia flexa]